MITFFFFSVKEAHNLFVFHTKSSVFIVNVVCNVSLSAFCGSVILFFHLTVKIVFFHEHFSLLDYTVAADIIFHCFFLFVICIFQIIYTMFWGGARLFFHFWEKKKKMNETQVHGTLNKISSTLNKIYVHVSYIIICALTTAILLPCIRLPINLVVSFFVDGTKI